MPDRYEVERAMRADGAWMQAGTAAANTAVTVTKTGAPGRTHYVTGFMLGYSDGAAAGLVTLKDGPDTIGLWYISGASSVTFDVPVRIRMGNNVSLTLAAGGTGITGAVTLMGFTAG